MSQLRDDWNDDIRSDIGHPDFSELIVYSRDWTVDTIITQLRQGNIDVNPKFQRRNAWKDSRRSLLIESLILGIPVPELVLAEDRQAKKKFLVIDGKQRLLTLAGFIDHDDFGFWNTPKLIDLETRASLNGLDYENLSEQERRSLMNADVRCTVISNYSTDDVLYDIFYRLNTGSVPLSTQELRQVLKRGDFANYLISTTNRSHPIQTILKLTGPDARLRDVEILLRYLAFELGEIEYRGNLKEFLDATMEFGNQKWEGSKKRIAMLDKQVGSAVELGQKLLDDPHRIGRKVLQGKYQSRFNKAVFEVQIYYFCRLIEEGKGADQIRPKAIKAFQEAHLALWESDEFIRAVEVTTKSLDQYRTRFTLFEKMINSVFGLDLDNAKRLFPEDGHA